MASSHGPAHEALKSAEAAYEKQVSTGAGLLGPRLRAAAALYDALRNALPLVADTQRGRNLQAQIGKAVDDYEAAVKSASEPKRMVAAAKVHRVAREVLSILEQPTLQATS